MDDAYDTDNGGNTISPLDTDGDSVPDYLDTDSDADQILDITESQSLNIAEGKTVSASSVLAGDTSVSLDNATDGNTKGNFSDGDLAHTGAASDKEWIEVDLGELIDISRIKIWNRMDCCQDRLGNVYVLVSETAFADNFDPASGAVASKHQFAANESGNPEIQVNTRGRYVRLQKSGDNSGGNAINIAEIQVFEDKDTDNDGILDYRDIDSDGDGIPDNIEAQTTAGYIPASGTDTDGDGLDDAYDSDNGGSTTNPVDTDNDGTPDYFDTDSDNDSAPDDKERGVTNPITSPSDLSNTNSATDVDFRDPGVTLSADSFDIDVYKDAFRVEYNTITQKTELFLKSDDIGQLIITINSMSGQTIFEQVDTKNTELWKYSLEANTLSAGVYLVELSIAKHHWTKEIILK